MEADPWTTFEQRYQVGDVITKPITKITAFGVFIEIEPGIEGLAHVSELSWTKKVTNPKELYNIGDVVSAQILGYDLDKKRVSLGIKQLLPNPWDTIAEEFPAGKVFQGKVAKLTNAGAYIELGNGIDGFLHIEDVAWNRKFNHMNQFCKVGDMLEVKVKSVDPENRRVRLTVKDITGNPWDNFRKSYPRNTNVTGTISSVTDFGVFVKLPGDIEGLVSKFNLGSPDEDYTDKLLESYKDRIGEQITVTVLDVNPQTQKINLSEKESIRKKQASDYAQYMEGKEEDIDTYNPFAEILKDKN